MENIKIIYWSGTGNTKMMAEAVAEGVGAVAELRTVDQITASEAAQCSALALGCSAMGSEVLEEYEFEPFFTELEPLLKGKRTVLFGSYGWGGTYMQDWQRRVVAAGGQLLADGVLALGTPDEGVLEECRQLGALLAK